MNLLQRFYLLCSKKLSTLFSSSLPPYNNAISWEGGGVVFRLIKVYGNVSIIKNKIPLGIMGYCFRRCDSSCDLSVLFMHKANG